MNERIDVAVRFLIWACGLMLLYWCIAGCASPEVDALLLKQRAIQDCIISGGTPHAAAGDEVWCSR